MGKVLSRTELTSKSALLPRAWHPGKTCSKRVPTLQSLILSLNSPMDILPRSAKPQMMTMVLQHFLLRDWHVQCKIHLRCTLLTPNRPRQIRSPYHSTAISSQTLSMKSVLEHTVDSSTLSRLITGKEDASNNYARGHYTLLERSSLIRFWTRSDGLRITALDCRDSWSSTLSVEVPVLDSELY